MFTSPYYLVTNYSLLFGHFSTFFCLKDAIRPIPITIGDCFPQIIILNNIIIITHIQRCPLMLPTCAIMMKYTHYSIGIKSYLMAWHSRRAILRIIALPFVKLTSLLAYFAPFTFVYLSQSPSSEDYCSSL